MKKDRVQYLFFIFLFSIAITLILFATSCSRYTPVSNDGGCMFGKRTYGYSRVIKM